MNVHIAATSVTRPSEDRTIYVITSKLFILTFVQRMIARLGELPKLQSKNVTYLYYPCISYYCRETVTMIYDYKHLYNP